MSTTNPVYQVLFPKGNQAILGAGQPISALGVGQIGLFDYHTNLSVGAGSGAGLNQVYILVGTDKKNTGALTNVDRSAGQYIPRKLVKSVTLKPYMESAPGIVEVSGFSAKCETEYLLKLELKNQKIFSMSGYNGITKSYSYKSACCEDQCVGCGDGDGFEVALGLLQNINNDADKLATASLYANTGAFTFTSGANAGGNALVTVGQRQYSVAVANADSAAVVAGKVAQAINDAEGEHTASVAGAVVTVRNKNGAVVKNISTSGVGTAGTFAAGGAAITPNNYDTFRAANKGVSPSIRITTNPASVIDYGGSIDFDYQSALETDVEVYLRQGFDCNGVVTRIQNVQFADGAGRNAKQEEYFAAGWNTPGPYRQHAITGAERQGFGAQADVNAKYNVISITYDLESVGGWLEYKNNLETVIYIECADTTTLGSTAAVFDVWLDQFKPMSPPVASTDCTNVRTELATVANNGIASLA